MASWWSRARTYLSFERSASSIRDLDGLRALAIILVLLRHAARSMGYDTSFSPTYPVGGWDLMVFFLNGWAGVDLFFVLSGFLITHQIVRASQSQLDKSWSMKSYLIKRILRIAPAYYATLAMVVIGLPFYPIDRHALEWRTAYHLLFLQDYLVPNIVSAFWSLGVEEKFYLSLPLVMLPILRLPRLSARLACVAGLYCLPVVCRGVTCWNLGQVDHLQYFLQLRAPFHVTADGLVMGCLVALLYHGREDLAWLHKPAVRHGLVWSGGVLSLLLLGSDLLLRDFTLARVVLTPCLLDLGFASLMLGLLLLGRSVYSTFFSSSALFFFCKLSYSLYLVHMIFMKCTVEWLWPRYSGLGMEHFHPTGSFFTLFLLAFTAVSVAAALLLHYVVEKPFLLLKDRIKV